MRNVLPILLIVCVCICLTASPQSTTQAQRTAKPPVQAAGAAKVDLFIKAVQDAKSFAEVYAAYNQAQFTQNELDQLKKKVESSASLKQKFDQLHRQALVEMKPKFEQDRRAAAARFSSTQRQIKEKQTKESLERASQMKRMVGFDPNLACPADTPTITKIYGPATKVHGGVKGIDCLTVHVYQCVAGPKGLPHRY